jgi:hypothetical protein
MGVSRTPPARAQRRRDELTAEIAALGWVLPGTLTDRFTRCGTPTCRCRANPPQLHGPYPTWTRKIANKTITRTLTAEQAELCRPWFDNARRLRALLTELEGLSLQAANLTDNRSKK